MVNEFDVSIVDSASTEATEGVEGVPSVVDGTENETAIDGDPVDNSRFAQVRNRLEEIVQEVNAEGISLDDALGLYDEAVKLALKACDVCEEDINEELPNS